jgi:hypothetical protein
MGTAWMDSMTSNIGWLDDVAGKNALPQSAGGVANTAAGRFRGRCRFDRLRGLLRNRTTAHGGQCEGQRPWKYGPPASLASHPSPLMRIETSDTVEIAGLPRSQSGCYSRHYQHHRQEPHDRNSATRSWAEPRSRMGRGNFHYFTGWESRGEFPSRSDSGLTSRWSLGDLR